MNEMATVFIDTADGGRIETDVFQGRPHAVCLFHGKRFDKNVWDGFVDDLLGAGFSVYAPNFRGYGRSTAGSAGADQYAIDAAAVLAHAQSGCEHVSALGASMAGPALLTGLCLDDRPIDHIVLLSPAWEPPSGYDCLQDKARDALLWYGEQERYAAACAAIASNLPFPVEVQAQASALHAHAYFNDPELGPKLVQTILDYLKGGR